MDIWPRAEAFIYPPSSASANPSGMLNIISCRFIHVAIREAQRMTGSCNSVFSRFFQFGMHSSPSVISIMPASICHPQASFMRTCTSPQPESTTFASFTKCSFALFSLFHQLPSFHYGLRQWLSLSLLSWDFKRYLSPKSMTSNMHTRPFLLHTTVRAHPKTHQLRKATSVVISQILLTRLIPWYFPGPFHVFTMSSYLVQSPSVQS